jgi:hypothetical protein
MRKVGYGNGSEAESREKNKAERTSSDETTRSRVCGRISSTSNLPESCYTTEIRDIF